MKHAVRRRLSRLLSTHKDNIPHKMASLYDALLEKMRRDCFGRLRGSYNLLYVR